MSESWFNQDGKDVLSKLLRDGVLVLAVRGRHDLGGSILAEDEVDDVEEARKVAVLVLVTDGDEDRRDTGGNADGVLDVEVRLNTRIAALRVGATVECLEAERGARRDVGAELAQEALLAGETVST